MAKAKQTERTATASPHGKKLMYGLLAVGALLAVLAIITLATLSGVANVPFLSDFLSIFVGPTSVELLIPCEFPPGMTCSSYKLHTDGSLDLRIGQAISHPIRIDSIACVPRTSAVTEPSASDYVPVNVLIPHGEQSWVSGPLANATIRCGTGGQLGDWFRGKIWMKYTETDTNMSRTVVGDLVIKYEQ